MITYAFLRLLYGVYFTGIAAILLIAISRVLFPRKMRRWSAFYDLFMRQGPFVFFWPMALLTRKGRGLLWEFLSI